MTPVRSASPLVLAYAACLIATAAPIAPAAADDPAAAPATASLRSFLAEKGIDRAARRPLEEAAAWDDAVQQAAVRVLLRLAAPRELSAAWRADATAFDPAAEIEDRLVEMRGRAVFVAQQPLTPEQRELAAGRTHIDVVRLVDAAGVPTDVITLAAPRGWARDRAIDEPAVASGLVVSRRIAPTPAGWPDTAPAALVAATDIGWFPATPLGRLGMDYALFDTVADGRRLEPGDSDAFFAMLAACRGADEAPAAQPTAILPLIDPTRKWFATHRGDEVVIAGIARRVTRIAIDEPVRRAEVGADHYWELFVFVPTPPLSVDGTLQDSFPIVCCIRDLPPGMPTGDQISESVVVPGFALKRYAYPLADAVIGDAERKGERRETALVIGRRAVWQPRPSTRLASDVLFAVFAALAALVAAALAWGGWSMRRDARIAAARARAELPEKLELPGDGG